jgi:hypothetical protein
VRDDPFYFHSGCVGKRCVCCAIGRSSANHRPSEKRSPDAPRTPRIDIESRATPTNDLAIVSSSRRGPQGGGRQAPLRSAAVPSAAAAAACRARGAEWKKPAAAPIEQSAGVAPLAFIYVSWLGLAGCV